ncbi:MAG: hypothetical protein GC129_03180 [Proteobacteria bacterium]|nr:hypothetical protein [Pseudomonadota bacterium]
MTTTAAVMTASATGAGNAGITQTSIDGLFALFLGGAAGDGGGTDAGADLLGLLGGDTAAGAAGLQATQVQLGDDKAVDVQGDSDTVSAFLQQVTAVFQKVILDGGVHVGSSDKTAELATALTKLGMDPDQAQQMAQRVETMMDLLKKSGMDEGQGDTVAAMLLTAMMSQQGGAALRVEVASQGQGVRVDVAEKFKISGPLSGEDLLAAVVRQNAAKSGETLQKGADGAATALPQAAKSGKGGKDIEGKDAQPRKAVVQVSKDSDGANAVALVLPAPEQVKATAQSDAAAPVAVAQADAKPEVSQLVAAPQQVQAVAKERELEKPSGETVFAWKADDNGHETLVAVRPAHGGNDASWLGAQQQAAAQSAKVADAGLDAAAQADAFSQKLATAQHARVAEQVAVQMKPLADAGGGTVRMTLNPPELGQVRIELSVRDGAVHGSISADSTVVVEQLARELHSLRHGLADAGMKLGEQGINLMLSNNGHQQQGHGQGGNANPQGMAGWRAPGEDFTPAGVEAEVPAAAWVAPDRVLDMSV